MGIGLKNLIDTERKPTGECSGLETPGLRLLPVSFSPSVLGIAIKYIRSLALINVHAGTFE